jgi:mannosyltransferase
MIISKKTIYTISIIFVFVVAVYLRLYHLGSRPLYLDEPDNTVAVAVHSVSYIISTNFGSILYPLLLHFLLPLGQIELIARIPAALFGILSVWIIYLIEKTVLSRKEAILAALFSAVSTHFLYFSQQARGYSGLL